MLIGTTTAAQEVLTARNAAQDRLIKRCHHAAYTVAKRAGADRATRHDAATIAVIAAMELLRSYTPEANPETILRQAQDVALNEVRRQFRMREKPETVSLDELLKHRPELEPATEDPYNVA